MLAAAGTPGVSLGVDDVRPYLGEAGAVPPYVLTNAIEAGDPATALELLHRLLTTTSAQSPKPMHALQVMGILNGYYRRILRLDDPSLRSPADAVAALGGKVKEYPARKALDQARTLGSGGIRQAFDALFQADLDLKGARGIPEQAVMEVLVVRLARLTHAHRRRSQAVSVRLRDLLMQQLGALRHEPTDKRIRAAIGDRMIVDSTRRAPGVGTEARRPDVCGARRRHRRRAPERAFGPCRSSRRRGGHGCTPPRRPRGVRPVDPFAVHTTDGEATHGPACDGDRDVDAFRAADPDLAGYVLLDFAGFDDWYEEDDLNLAHPRDPFHRVDIVHSSRHVRVELDGRVLAETTSPYLLFEPPLPVRYYFALGDVSTDLLAPSELTTRCAYKGEATYFSVPGTRHRLGLPRTAARRGRDHGADRLLQRARRPLRRRRPAAAAHHPVVTSRLTGARGRRRR